MEYYLGVKKDDCDCDSCNDDDDDDDDESDEDDKMPKRKKSGGMKKKSEDDIDKKNVKNCVNLSLYVLFL